MSRSIDAVTIGVSTDCTTLAIITRAHLAGEAETVESVLAYAPRPSTLAAPLVMPEESDVPGGRIVLRYVDPVAGVCIRAHIRATFTGPPHVRVTGRNRHGARDWLAERLATILDARHAPYAPEGADLPSDLPPELQ